MAKLARRTLVATMLVSALRDTASAGACVDSESSWDGTLLLSNETGFAVQWKVEGEDLTLALSAESVGWVGFGFGEFTSGSMIGADILTARFSDGSPVVEDRYVPWQAFPFAPFDSTYRFHDANVDVATSPSLFPELDCVQDWTVVRGSKDGDCLLVVAKRKLSTQDQFYDRPVVLDRPMRVLWAQGSSSSVSYHGTERGTNVIDFGAASHNTASCQDCESLDLQISNYQVLAQTTTYTCQSFELPEQQRHVVKIEPIIDNAKVAHHILVHVCNNDAFFQSHLGNPTPCFSTSNTVGNEGNSPLGLQCQTLMYAWAIGGGPLELPEEAGFLIGTGGIRHVVLEVHYDNPQKATGERDSSIIRLTTTANLRPHDAGVIVAGDPQTSHRKLAKGQPLVHRVGECPSECTQKFTEPAKVFSSFLHMHSFGKRMWTNRVNKDGVFQEETNAIEFWNFGFQQLTPVNFTIDPGDSLFVHCEYDTSKWPRDVSFGVDSLDEMCMDFLFYYPIQRDQEGDEIALCGGAINTYRYAQIISEFNPDFDLDDVLAVFNMYPELEGQMAFPLCGLKEVDNPYKRNIMGFELDLQRTDPTWDGATYVRKQHFAPGKCQKTTVPPPPDDGGTSSDDPNYDFMISPINKNDFTFHWRVVENLQRCYLSAKLTVKGERWVSFGLGSEMANSKIILAMSALANADFTQESVGEYTIGEERARSAIVKYQGETGLLDDSAWAWSTEDGVVTLRVNLTSIAGAKLNLPCNVESGRRRLDAVTDSLIFAYGPDGAFEAHDTDARSALVVNWESGTLNPSSKPRLMLQAHAFLMTIGMCILLPFGIFSGVTKHSTWFAAHRAMVLLAFVLVTVGLFLAISFVSNHGSKTHHIIGFVTVGLMWINPVVGVARPEKEASSRQRWLAVHRLVAAAALGLGLYNVYSGAELVASTPEFFGDSSKAAAIGFIVTGAVITLTAIILRVVRGPVQTNKTKQSEEMDV